MKSLVLLSGGMDSAAALEWVKGDDVVTLGFNHPARPKREIEAARRLAAGARQFEVPVDFLVTDAPSGYLPRRNLVYYAIAASIAEREHCDRIVGGQLRTDSQGYADAAETYLRSIEALAGVKIFLPLIAYTKMELILLARRRGLSFEGTWSCFRDVPAPCGECFSCVDRRRSFAAVGLEDPAR